MQCRTNYCYTAYDFTIHSQLPLPGLLPASNECPDVTIRYGEIPDALPAPSHKFGIWEAAPGKFLIDVADVARYFIVDGREIWIERVSGSMDDDVRTFLLGSAMGALLQQRHILTLHASAIQAPQGAVLFLGRSGSGKSTLATALLKRGYAMLADDITGITLNSHDGLVALPALPRTRLWADSAAKLDYDIREQPQVRVGVEKYLRPAEHFCKKALPVYAIYVLTSHNKAKFKFEAVATPQRFEWLYKYTYRKKFVHALAVEKEHFHSATALAKQVKMSRITRPVHPFLLDELVDRVEEDLSSGI